MTPEERLAASLAGMPPPAANAARAGASAHLDNVTVTKADGRVFDFGRPGTLRFRWRVLRYRINTHRERRAT